jgi:hypothetical protein
MVLPHVIMDAARERIAGAYLALADSVIELVRVSKVGAHKALLAIAGRLGHPRANGVAAGDGALEVAA